jgi:uncharacterized repeat protein (TIGR01451 family)
VIDNMPVDVGSLTVLSYPTGSTNSSSPTGGTNGTGQVNVNNITVPANTSVTLVYEVTISATATPGEILTNTATVANNDDPNGIVPSPPPSTSIKVEQSLVPSSGNKILYVHNDTSPDSLSRTPQTATGGGVSIDRGNTSDWTLSPALQKNLTLTGNSTISVNLLVECTQLTGGGNCRSAGNLSWNAALYDNTVSAGTRIGAISGDVTFNYTSYTLVTATITVPAGGYTVTQGHKLILRITNSSSRDRPMQIEQYNGGSRSYLILATSTVINVDSVTAYAATYPSTTQSPPYRQNGAVYLRAVVSDPFGSYDINPATGGVAPTITIKDSNNTTQLTATNMTLVNDSSAATKTFEYVYTVPAVPAIGYWTASVTATEGNASKDSLYNGGSNITHTANGAFDVEVPNLVLMKSVSVLSDPTGSATPHAVPGAILQYSINVTNQGQGKVDANTVNLGDVLDTNTAFIVGSTTFTDGSPTSGLSFNPATNLEYCTGAGGSTCPYTSGVGAGNPDSAITKVIFTPSGTLNGKASAVAPAPGFTIKYKVELK